MNQSRARVAGALALAAVVFAPAADAQQTPQRAEGTVKEAVRAVLVDVVVRDKRGQPVRDLTQDDFQIVEDGVPQTIGSFAPVFDRAAAPSGAGAPAAPPATVSAGAPLIGSGPGVTALVFDRLGPESRRLAALAARNYLGSKEESNDFVAVFGIDLALTPYVPFTRNAVALRKALDAVVTSVNTGFNTPEQRRAITEATQTAIAANKSATNAIASAGGAAGGANVGTAPGAAILTQLQVDMVRDFEDMDLDQKGYATTNALFAIIRSMARIPGRKNIVLFSEGISTTAAVHRLYLGVMDAANRANVSIYTLDAVGLRAESDQARIRDAVNAQGAVGINSGYSDSGGGGGGAYTTALERNEGTLRSDPANTLGELAKSTGGMSFSNTNNLRPAFERIESDIRNYYLLGYTPRNDNFDGRFRNIDVIVTRPDVTVSARRGYFALRDPGGMAVNAWEAPALAAFEQKPVPNAFPVRAGAMLFPERGRPGLVPVIVELKTEPLAFQPAPDKKSYTSDVTVLVRFVDDQKQVVRKVSQHYEVTGPIEQMDGARRGEILFYRDSELPAGLYSMETIVYDALSGKSSVRFSTVEVPKYAEGTLRVSSLVQVKRAEKVPENERPANTPFLVKDVLLYPNLGDPVSKAAKEVGFYFVVYPAPGGATPSASIELMQDGKLAAQIPMPLAAQDGNGRIQQIGRLPLDQLAPGIYELRAVVKQGSSTVVRTTMLRITE